MAGLLEGMNTSLVTRRRQVILHACLLQGLLAVRDELFPCTPKCNNNRDQASGFTNTHPEPTSRRRRLGSRRTAPEAALPAGSETGEWGLQTCLGPIEARLPVACFPCRSRCSSGTEQMSPANPDALHLQCLPVHMQMQGPHVHGRSRRSRMYVKLQRCAS